MANGFKPSELAQSLGLLPSAISEELASLRLEIMFSQGIFPQMPDDQYEALCENIAENGVLVPIIVDEDGEVIDGRHRKKAAAEVGRECPFEVHSGLTLREKRELSISLNAGRRHMTGKEKRMLVVAELMGDREKSDRAIARLAGVSPTTVGTVRRELEIAEGVYESAEPTPEDEAVVSNLDTLPEKIFGVAECPCCSQRLRILKARGEFLLEALDALAA